MQRGDRHESRWIGHERHPGAHSRAGHRVRLRVVEIAQDSADTARPGDWGRLYNELRPDYGSEQRDASRSLVQVTFQSVRSGGYRAHSIRRIPITDSLQRNGSGNGRDPRCPLW